MEESNLLGRRVTESVLALRTKDATFAESTRGTLPELKTLLLPTTLDTLFASAFSQQEHVANGSDLSCCLFLSDALLLR